MRIENIDHKYQKTRHSVYACEYHIIWCTKYRRGVLSPEIQERLKELILEAQMEYGYTVRAVETMSDHVHILISIPPTVSVNTIVGRIKGYASRILREEYPELTSRLPSLWTRSKFVASTGGVTLEVIKEYIESQKKPMKAYKYKIQTHKRNRHLQKDLLIIAHVHNHFVALWQRHYKIYGQCEGYKRPSAFRMIKHLTKLKRLDKYQHWTIPYSWCLQECVQRVDRGWKNFFEGRAKRPPKFRSRHKYKSMTFDGSQVKIETIDKTDGCPVAKIRINRRWYRFWYSRPIEGNIKQVTVKKDFVGDWYLTITTDEKGLEPAPKTGETAGFDFGLKDFLTCSDGTKYQSPEFYKTAATLIKRASRALSRKQKGSNNRERARKDLARVHRKINRQREDHHWKLALELVRRFDVCYFEDLTLEGMKRIWGRKVSDYAFGDFMQKIKWQAQKRDKSVAQIDRWTPTSKVCHACGQFQLFFDLNIREWYCQKCKIHHERDINAAINIHKVGASTFGGEGVRLASASNL